nr:enolase C-terminal domain-like protein [Lysobacter enzymogenes]
MPSRARLQMSLAIEPLPLKAPFAIAGHRFEAMPALVATLSDDDGHRGRGEACGVYYLDDHPASMHAALEARREAIEAGIDRAALQTLLPPRARATRWTARCGNCRRNANAGRCGRWPGWRRHGRCRPRSPRRRRAGAGRGRRALAQARLLKLKLDGDAELDIARIAAARAARPDVRLMVDANQAYTLQRIAPLIAALADHRVELLEQPFARGREADLDALDCPVAVAADESVQGLDELDALAGRCDFVNLKLDKCGGLTEALAMAARARTLGLRCMVGNMLGTSWAAAPAFALGQLCELVDLDGPSFIQTDRSPAVVYRDGLIHCPDEVWGGAGGVASRSAADAAASTPPTQVPRP